MHEIATLFSGRTYNRTLYLGWRAPACKSGLALIYAACYTLLGASEIFC